MVNVVTNPIPLCAYATTQGDAAQSLDVQLSSGSPGLLSLHYALRGDLSRIRVGIEAVSARADNLWKHTCFEAFIQPAGSAGYYEFNFSPTKQWAVYRFDGYRKGMTPMDVSYPPDISVRKSPGSLDLEVTFPLPVSYAVASRPKLALAAVVEEDSGRLSYWAARHPEGKPDFHHADGFIVEL